MPELAEVDFFRRRWDAGLGAKVLRVKIHRAARVFRGCEATVMIRHLEGASLDVSFAHGKQMLFGFSNGGWLGVHLGMTGELRADPAASIAAKHDHLQILQDGRSLVFADSRMFGRIRYDHSPNRLPGWWTALPPAVLSPLFTSRLVAAHLARRGRSPLKAVLLDQACFPGIGNWMADEILWRLGLHPLTPAGGLGAVAVRTLHRQTRWLARRALATIGVDWRDPPATWLYRHRWASGNRCPRCPVPLLREEAAGRTTCWCPSCQPEPDKAFLRTPRRAIGTGRRRQAGTG